TSGSDVWIKSGTTCSNQTLDIKWSGTVADRVVVGTYYVSGGIAYQLFPSNLSPSTLAKDYTWATPRAIIQGSYRASCRVWPSKCAYLGATGGGTPGSPIVPNGHYAALITNPGSKYVTIQSLEVRDSAGAGIAIDAYMTTGIYDTKGEAPTQL